MFTAYCDHEHADVLLGPRRIVSMHNTSDGIVAWFRCYCGALGYMVTGAHAAAPSAPRHTVRADLEVAATA